MSNSRAEYQRAWYAKNCDRIIASRRERHASRDDVRAKAQEYHQANRERINAARRGRHLLVRYGLTQKDFESLLESQGNRCAICQTDTEPPRGWHVDHDHDTNAVRGILCGLCNKGLGHFRDDIDALSRAIEYLRAHRSG